MNRDAASVNILGISVPARLVTPTIRKTDWRVEPIHSMSDINKKWIGRRVYQVSPAVIRVIWNIDSEIEIINRQYAAKVNAQNTANADGDDSFISECLLGDLRYLFLLDCLLCNHLDTKTP